MILRIKYWRNILSDNSFLKMKKLTPKELDDMKKCCEDSLLETKNIQNRDQIKISELINTNLDDLQSNLENWVDNKFNYLTDLIGCLTPFATEKLNQSILNSIVYQLNDIHKRYDLIRTRNIKTNKDLPFNSPKIKFIITDFLPIVAQIIIFEKQLNNAIPKYYKI